MYLLCVHVRARARVCVCVCVCVFSYEKGEWVGEGEEREIKSCYYVLGNCF